MPRRCTICTHKSRAKIDKALVARDPFRTIAGQYQVSKSALVRHHDDHLPAALVKAQEGAEAAQADALRSQVVDLRDKALGCVELLAKLAGRLKDAPTVNILVSAARVDRPGVRREQKGLASRREGPVHAAGGQGRCLSARS